jgi:uncharacterized protein (DUF1800 family)
VLFSLRTFFNCAVHAGLLGVVAGGLAAQAPRLANLSTRASAGSGDAVLTAGFVIGPGANRTVLVRAIGPTLASFGVNGAMANPALALFGANGSIAQNDDWTAADAATFASVGAFALPANSRDAALVRVLSPGNYTAQVSSQDGAPGAALIEVYEAGASGARLLNISTRAQVGPGASAMISGLVVSPGSGSRLLLIRAAGPALRAFGVGASALADPTLVVTATASSTPLAANDNWSAPDAGSDFTTAVLSEAFALAGAFAFPAGSRDAALLVDLPPGNYTTQVTGVPATGSAPASGASGVALVEIYDLTPAAPPSVTLAATRAATDESGATRGEFTLTRTGHALSPLTVRYRLGGTATHGTDYARLPGAITFPRGARTITLPLVALPDLPTEAPETVVLTLSEGTDYVLPSPQQATVTIADRPGTLYVAVLRPTSGAVESTASGVATLILGESGTLAAVNVGFSNLTSAGASAYLRAGTAGDLVFALPVEQSVNTAWIIAPTGRYSQADLLAALGAGQLSVGLDTARYSTGELRGAFVRGAGSATFTPPANPPAIDLSRASASAAARLLTQATFGPTRREIDSLTGQSLEAWITAQLALPFTSHRAAVLADVAAFGGAGENEIGAGNRQAAWFKTVLTAPDQLRQRVAFALSELFVVSDVSLGQPYTEGLTHYYDLLGQGAFGNFRTLLENVTLSPIMGTYLSHLRNAKADPASGTSPDENFAREVMQLFTIGLHQLHPDGTLRLGPDALPLPTYDLATITETARVFTGWAFPSGNPNAFRSAPPDYIASLQLYPAFHDDGAKRIVGGVNLPAAQGGAKDLQLTLDALFEHANTPPFIARHLIQRLVTSNPSPAYVYRVAARFRDNGAGRRGDLAATVRAVLTDYEARSPALLANVGHGKLKEPLLRLTALLRGFGAAAQNGRYLGNNSVANFTNLEIPFAQAALRSPTVFNFFSPHYVLPGPLARAGLVVPEFEITDTNHAISTPNFLRAAVFVRSLNNATAVALNLTRELELLATPDALLDHLALVLCAGALPADVRTRVRAALAALPANTPPEEQVQTAIILLAADPVAAVQK